MFSWNVLVAIYLALISNTCTQMLTNRNNLIWRHIILGYILVRNWSIRPDGNIPENAVYISNNQCRAVQQNHDLQILYPAWKRHQWLCGTIFNCIQSWCFLLWVKNMFQVLTWILYFRWVFLNVLKCSRPNLAVSQ